MYLTSRNSWLAIYLGYYGHCWCGIKLWWVKGIQGTFLGKEVVDFWRGLTDYHILRWGEGKYSGCSIWMQCKGKAYGLNSQTSLDSNSHSVTHKLCDQDSSFLNLGIVVKIKWVSTGKSPWLSVGVIINDLINVSHHHYHFHYPHYCWYWLPIPSDPWLIWQITVTPLPHWLSCAWHQLRIAQILLNNLLCHLYLGRIISVLGSPVVLLKRFHVSQN